MSSQTNQKGFLDPDLRKEFKDELISALLKYSFQYSEEPIFKLACGKMSQFYVNCKETTMRAEAIQQIGMLMIDSIYRLDVSATGGLTFGADPIANAAMYASRSISWINSIDSFSVRKELKDHGIVKWIEGPARKGDKVAIIDDVCTTGGSTIKAIERARAEGLEVVCARLLIDRQEMNGIENIREHVEDVKAIITIDELLKKHKENC